MMTATRFSELRKSASLKLTLDSRLLNESLDEIERLRFRPQGAIWQDLIAEIGRLQGELARRDAILEQDLLR